MLTPPASLWPDPAALGLLTDLYELTMMAGYHACGMAEHPAVFELFVRKLPANRAYCVFAGLEPAIGDVLRMAVSPEQIAYLRSLPAFSSLDGGFFDWLADLRFRGSIWSVPEGTVVFPNETWMRIEAPLAQAQWIETYLIAAINYPTLVASKAARVVAAAAGRPCVEFGARRGHGPHAALLAARAAYVAGFAGTSHVEAARRLGIPPYGTMAHSWVQSFPNEDEAFEHFARVFPRTSTLLVDTYDTLEGVRAAARITPAVPGIRVDSGDLDVLSREARRILDDADRRATTIFASGDLDEARIEALVRAGAPIDAFGIGTELITSRDAPTMAMVYKLVELDGQGRFKRSPGKRTYPLGKQVWRRTDPSGRFAGDHVTIRDETAEGEPLLECLVRDGELVRPLPDLAAIRDRCRRQIQALPDAYHALDATPVYPITYSDALEAAARQLGL